MVAPEKSEAIRDSVGNEAEVGFAGFFAGLPAKKPTQI